MADSVQIPVEFSGWDKVINSIEGTTKASKELGDQMKKALMGEVLVQSINKVGSSIGGVEGAAVSAVGSIAQGFMQGGPVGAAIAATGVAFTSLFQVIEYGKAELVKQDAILEKIAIERVEKARQVRQAEEAEAKVRFDTAVAYLDAGEEKVREADARAKARREQNERDAIESTTRQIEAEYGQRRVAQEIQDEAFARFLRDTDAIIIRDAEAKARTAIAAQERVFEEASRARESAQFSAEADTLTNDLLDDLVAKSDEASRAIGGTLGVGLSQATDALFAMDAAQIQAAASAGTLAGSLAEAAARGVSAQLQSIAQRETVEALASAAMGFGRLAIYDAKGAGESFTAAALHGAAAVAAGAGAVALNTAASAVAPRAAPAPTQSGSASTGSSSRGGSGGGVSIVVNTNRLFSTEAEIGAAVEKSRRDFQRYRGV